MTPILKDLPQNNSGEVMKLIDGYLLGRMQTRPARPILACKHSIIALLNQLETRFFDPLLQRSPIVYLTDVTRFLAIPRFRKLVGVRNVPFFVVRK